MKNLFKNWKLFIVAIIALGFASCEEVETPTHELMQGVWEVTEAYDASDSTIVDNVNFMLPTYIWLDDMNGVISTAGPMFMHIVYGPSKFIAITSKLDQAFQYSDLTLTNGEFFMEKDKVVERFTIEMKLKFPTVETIESILNLMGIDLPSFIESVIYHKFINVKVEIDDRDTETMVWTFDDVTEARYNIKDQYGDYVSWTGMPAENFQKCRFVMTKKVGTIDQLVTDYYSTK